MVDSVPVQCQPIDIFKWYKRAKIPNWMRRNKIGVFIFGIAEHERGCPSTHTRRWKAVAELHEMKTRRRDERWGENKNVKSRPINDPYHQQTDVGRPNKRLRFHFVRTAQNNKSRNENDLFDTFLASIVVVSSDARNSPYALARIAFVAKRLLLFSLSLCVCARVAAGLRNWIISSLARKDLCDIAACFASTNVFRFVDWNSLRHSFRIEIVIRTIFTWSKDLSIMIVI